MQKYLPAVSNIVPKYQIPAQSKISRWDALTQHPTECTITVILFVRTVSLLKCNVKFLHQFKLLASPSEDSLGNRYTFLCLLLLVTVKQVTNCEKENFYREHQQKDTSTSILNRKLLTRLCRVNLKNKKKGLCEYIVPRLYLWNLLEVDKYKTKSLHYHLSHKIKTIANQF